MIIFYSLIMRDFVFILESTVRPNQDPCGFTEKVNIEIEVKITF